MKQDKTTQALQKHLTQEKWWVNPKLEDMWVTTQLNTRALVLHVFKGGYILLDKHYNQLKVHSSRIREPYDVVVQKHLMLCNFIIKISPKVKKKKTKLSEASGVWSSYYNRGGTTPVDQPERPLSNQSYVQLYNDNTWGDPTAIGIRIMEELEDDIDE